MSVLENENNEIKETDNTKNEENIKKENEKEKEVIQEEETGINEPEHLSKFRIAKAYRSINLLLFIIIILIAGIFIINTVGDKAWRDASAGSEDLILKKHELEKSINNKETELLKLNHIKQNLIKFSTSLEDVNLDVNCVIRLSENIDSSDIVSNETIVRILKCFRKEIISLYRNNGFYIDYYKQNNREYLKDNYVYFSRDNFFNSQEPQKYIESVINTQIFTSTNLFLTNEYSQNTLIISIREPTSFFENNLDKIKNIIMFTSARVAYFIEYNKLHKEENEREITKLQRQLESINENNLRKILAKFILPFYGIIALLLLLIPYVYKKIFNEKRANDILLKIFDQNLILKIFAVFILTATILILGIGGIIQENVLGTLLGGITVYVLQGSLGKKDGNNNPII